jgi:hypothetical protein
MAVTLVLCLFLPACFRTPMGSKPPPGASPRDGSTDADVGDSRVPPSDTAMHADATTERDADATSAIRTDVAVILDADAAVSDRTDTMRAVDTPPAPDVPRIVDADASAIRDTPRTADADAAALVDADAARPFDAPRVVDIAPDAPRVIDADAAPSGQLDGSPGHKRAWQGPELIEDFSFLSYSARVVMDVQGNVTAVWRQNDQSPHAEGVGTNRFDRQTGAWGHARFIDDGKHVTSTPALAVDGRGSMVAVWEQERTFGWPHDVHGARFDTSSGDWQAPGLVAQSESEGMLGPVVGLDDAGDGAVVWLESHAKSGHSLYQSHLVGGAWQGAGKLLDQRSGNPGYPRLAVDSAGNVTVMWAEVDGPHTGLYLRRMDPEIFEWSSDVVLCSEPCYMPTLAVDWWAGGAAAWLSAEGTDPRLHIAYLGLPDGVWQEEPLPDAIPAAPVYASVAAANRSAVLVWKQDEDPGTVYASMRGSDGVWHPPVLLGSDAEQYTIPQAGFDGNGNIIATWNQGPDDAARVVAARYDASTGAWSQPVPLDNGAGSATDPILAVNGAGLAVVIWEQWQDGNGHLWANRWQ